MGEQEVDGALTAVDVVAPGPPSRGALERERHEALVRAQATQPAGIRTHDA
jgi:hypothetical protein